MMFYEHQHNQKIKLKFTLFTMLGYTLLKIQVIIFCKNLAVAKTQL